MKLAKVADDLVGVFYDNATTPEYVVYVDRLIAHLGCDCQSEWDSTDCELTIYDGDLAPMITFSAEVVFGFAFSCLPRAMWDKPEDVK